MSDTPIHAVTGAFGYSGKYIAQRLLAEGRRVITLTNSTDRDNAFGGRLPVLRALHQRQQQVGDVTQGAHANHPITHPAHEATR